jgi:hypothetical protein
MEKLNINFDLIDLFDENVIKMDENILMRCNLTDRKQEGID